MYNVATLILNFGREKLKRSLFLVTPISEIHLTNPVRYLKTAILDNSGSWRDVSQGDSEAEVSLRSAPQRIHAESTSDGGCINHRADRVIQGAKTQEQQRIWSTFKIKHPVSLDYISVTTCGSKAEVNGAGAGQRMFDHHPWCSAGYTQVHRVYLRIFQSALSINTSKSPLILSVVHQPRHCLQKKLPTHGLVTKFFMCGWTQE